MRVILAIKEFGTNKTIEEKLCKSINEAEKKQSLLNIILNHDKYYSEIETETEINRVNQ